MARQELNETEEINRPNDTQISKKKVYNKTIVNKWRLLIRLNLNKELIQFRKNNIRKNTKKKSDSMLNKVKTKVCSRLKSRKYKEDNHPNNKVQTSAV